MRENNIRAKTKRKFKKTTDSKHHLPVVPNLLAKEENKAKDINQVWAGDITYISTKEGWLFLAVILDLFSSYGGAACSRRGPIRGTFF